MTSADQPDQSSSLASPALQEAYSLQPVENPDVFWRETGKSLLRSSLTVCDELAKQLITVTGILLGLYINAIAISSLRTTVTDIGQVVIYLLPVVLQLVSLGFALMVFLTGNYPLNINAPEAAEILFHIVRGKKMWRVIMAAMFLGASLLTLVVAIVVYLLG